MKFVPTEPEKKTVPYFEDARAVDGYGGQANGDTLFEWWNVKMLDALPAPE